MSMTLNLADLLLAQGRNYQELHRPAEALAVLGRLAGLAHVPAAAAEEAQARLAEICLKRKKYRKARRHLAAALAYQPESARYHHLMATALDTRTNADVERAAEHFRKSLELDPKQPHCLRDYGQLLLRTGQVDAALQTLRSALELAPDDPTIVGKLVRGLRRAKLGDEARAILLAARFRNPRDGRFVRLYNDFMFRQLRNRQTKARRAVAAQTDEGPVLLPFVRARDTAPLVVDDKVIRLDQAEATSAPHTPPRSVRRSDWKHG
ncbi:MAG: tetratricopeptide repeat protein [Gemmataceae bacterium]|nr:tetratricopeptide repeat protein [Gemmataceae bacterium]